MISIQKVFQYFHIEEQEKKNVLEKSKCVDCPLWGVSTRISDHSHEISEQTVLALSFLKNGQNALKKRPES